MSGATVGILGYTKGIGSATSFPSAPSMFTLRGNGLATRLCQPATVSNYELDMGNRDQIISSSIRPFSHGITLPRLSQQSRHSTSVVVSHSRNNSTLLISPSHHSIIGNDHMRSSTFPNFRISEEGGKRDCSLRHNEDKPEKNSQSKECLTSVVSTKLDKDNIDDKTLDFKAYRVGCTRVSSVHDHKNSRLPSRQSTPLQRKKKSIFYKNKGRQSRCKTRREQKKGKQKLHFSNHHQNAMKSVRMSSSPILQVQAVPQQRCWKEASDNPQEISRRNQDSSTKSFRLSSSQSSLSSEVLQRASAIYSNLKNSQQVKEESEKVKRIYLSDKQSGVIKDCGIMLPCAPPCSPTVDQLKIVEYVPSMNDIRSQRAVKDRLSQMEYKAKKKELARKEEAKRTEKQLIKEQEVIKKQRQRLELYALNKIMTELEETQFQEFCRILKSGNKVSDSSSANNNNTSDETVENSEEAL